MKNILAIFSLLVFIELLLGYQMMSYLFANNEDIYIKEINGKQINIEFFMLGLAVIGIVQSIVFVINYIIKNTDTTAAITNVAKQKTKTDTQTNKTAKYFLYFTFFLLISASLGINSYFIYVYTKVKKGEIAIIKDNYTFNILQKLIPSSIGIFIILFLLSIFY